MRSPASASIPSTAALNALPAPDAPERVAESQLATGTFGADPVCQQPAQQRERESHQIGASQRDETQLRLSNARTRSDRKNKAKTGFTPPPTPKATCRTRTGDLSFTKASLYQLS